METAHLTLNNLKALANSFFNILIHIMV